MVDTFMRIDAVKAATGLGRSTIYEMMDAGKFPKPVKPNDDRAVRWLGTEIAAWQRSRIDARDAAVAA
ncbi:AlpA family phage regulatory protein [Tardiphaga sp.]|uniref:helix-turn-helix transcriptional regulator n=1 Tax=Tardiphaga sp. TaxID=1926292 RepID=UPI002625ADC9|nr:AlpA family phage regulatory protein [Tardiphaga sp.]MDB5617434.1 putative transcription factor, AlpA family [Tardiphaga sp.]